MCGVASRSPGSAGALWASTIAGGPPMPKALAAFEKAVAYDRKAVRDNHARLSELHRDPAAGVTVVSAHDPELLAQVRSAAGAP